MSRSGHYSGATSQHHAISFDVTEEGLVTNVLVTVDGDPPALRREVLLAISEAFPVDEHGDWAGRVAGFGIAAELRGHVNGDASATGTFEAELAAGAPGLGLRTGSIAWTARRTS